MNLIYILAIFAVESVIFPYGKCFLMRGTTYIYTRKIPLFLINKHIKNIFQAYSSAVMFTGITTAQLQPFFGKKR